ncbi:MAG: hypothetical protein Kow00124_21080 [Anaerolineae bacterium]
MTDSLHTRYTLTIEVLTPLHIGNGSELQRDVDYVARGGKTWVIDHEALMEALLDESGTFDNRLLTRPAAEVLGKEDFRQGSPYFRYVLPGEPRNRPLKEQIKDVWGNPYIPGSSIKGMMRTLILWGIFASTRRKPDLRRLGNSRSWAAQSIERAELAPAADGRDRQRVTSQNADLLRALQVGDSTPAELSSMRVCTAQIYPTARSGGRGVDVDVEALWQGAVLQAPISIDEYLFSERADKTLGLGNLRVWFDRIPKVGRVHASRRLADEMEYHSKRGPSYARSVCEWLIKQLEALDDSEWLAQIGWGGGWASKTLGDLLISQSDFERMVLGERRYRMIRGKRQPGDRFPKTRNLVLKDGAPSIPMGWVKCRLDLLE